MPCKPRRLCFPEHQNAADFPGAARDTCTIALLPSTSLAQRRGAERVALPSWCNVPSSLRQLNYNSLCLNYRTGSDFSILEGSLNVVLWDARPVMPQWDPSKFHWEFTVTICRHRYRAVEEREFSGGLWCSPWGEPGAGSHVAWAALAKYHRLGGFSQFWRLGGPDHCAHVIGFWQKPSSRLKTTG